MISHKFRFHGHGSLRYVYRNGETARNRHLMLRYTANKNRAHNRFAIVVAKKVVKSAVKRNRIRRRLYESMRRYEPNLHASYDFVVTVYSPDLLLIPSEEVDSVVKDVFKNAKLFDDKPTSDTLEVEL